MDTTDSAPAYTNFDDFYRAEYAPQLRRAFLILGNGSDEADTRLGHLDGSDPRFENIDPGLVDVVLEDGMDIYLWPIWVVPAIIAVVVMLAIAWFVPHQRRWAIAIRAAIVIVALGGTISLPTDFATNQAIQCLSE